MAELKDDELKQVAWWKRQIELAPELQTQDYLGEGAAAVVSLQRRLLEEREDSEKLREVLGMVHWVRVEGSAVRVCAWCKNRELDGDKPDCPRQGVVG
jgi:hypothetical protein